LDNEGKVNLFTAFSQFGCSDSKED